jgi:formate/nitrite transporter FocA (FNT family)
MNLQCIVFGIIFLLVGIAFFIGGGQNWIKAWREMPQEEKNKIRLDELSKNIGCVFLVASSIFLISGFSPEFFNAAFIWCMVAWFVLTGIDVAFITKSNRYKTE